MTAEQFKKREIENAPKGKPVAHDTTGVEWLREHRGVKSFEDFPYLTKRIYLSVAECFPGVQVYAVGSRVRGDYVDHFSHPDVFLARQCAGMKFKQESDFDFLVAPDAVQVGELPENTERVRVRVLKNEMVAIPIFQ